MTFKKLCVLSAIVLSSSVFAGDDYDDEGHGLGHSYGFSSVSSAEHDFLALDLWRLFNKHILNVKGSNDSDSPELGRIDQWAIVEDDDMFGGDDGGFGNVHTAYGDEGENYLLSDNEGSRGGIGHTHKFFTGLMHRLGLA